MTRLIASARFSRYSELSCCRSSQFSPASLEIYRNERLPFRSGAAAMLRGERLGNDNNTDSVVDNVVRRDVMGFASTCLTRV